MMDHIGNPSDRIELPLLVPNLYVHVAQSFCFLIKMPHKEAETPASAPRTLRQIRWSSWGVMAQASDEANYVIYIKRRSVHAGKNYLEDLRVRFQPAPLLVPLQFWRRYSRMLFSLSLQWNTSS